MKTLLGVQARTNSSRLPGKMLMPFGSSSLASFVMKRCSLLDKLVDDVVLLTSNEASDDELAQLISREGFKVFRGSLNNVLLRYIDCANHYKADTVVRVCGDSPFVDLNMIEIMLKHISEGFDYVSFDPVGNVAGFDSEVVKLESLVKSFNSTQASQDLEHVTPYIRNSCDFKKFQIPAYSLPTNSKLSFTVDDQPSYENALRVVKYLNSRIEFDSKEIINWILKS